MRRAPLPHRRPSFILPGLLVLALGAYLLPAPEPAQPAPTTQKPTDTAPALPELPAAAKAIFEQARPATVRVESLNVLKGSGGIGTGFLISASGQVLTAYHVVSGGQLFQVTTLSGQHLPVRVTGFDARRDVALLQIQPSGGKTGGPFPFLKVTTRAPRIGETVLAIGNSHGQYLQPRRGQLLALNVEAARADFPQGTLEMTAPLAPGDSGGPVLDGNGQAIGVVSYIRQQSDGLTASSYAVPVTEGGQLLADLRAGKKLDTPVVGLIFDPLHSGATNPPGAVIQRVARNSPGERAGLRGCVADQSGTITSLGDIILSVDGQPTKDASEFIQRVQGYQIGQTITLTYARGDLVHETRLTLAARSEVKDLNDDMHRGAC